MKKLTILFLFLMTFFTTSVSASELERYIVHFEQGIDYDLLQGIDYEVYHEFKFINRLAISLNPLDAETIKQHPTVSIEKDQEVTIEGQVVDYQHTWIKLKNEKDLGMTGTGVKVAVLDTGIRTDHPDLSVAGGINTISEGVSYDDDNGHGTHVAGVIAALDNDLGIKGISPRVELYAIKALDEHGEGKQTDIIAGIQWAIENDIDLINLSLTTEVSTEALKSILEYSYKQGIISVAASGNNYDGVLKNEDTVMYPAKYPFVIAVGSIGHEKLPSYFSQQGKSLEFVAPGEVILSTYIDDLPYMELSGTSMATPIVTGVLSLYKEVYPSLPALEIRSLAQENSLDLGVPGRDILYGYGLIQSPSSWFLDVVNEDWYFDAVQFLRREGLAVGFDRSLYKPQQLVTRAELATFIGRMLEVETDSKTTPFTDVPEESFATPYISGLVERGIIKGYPDNTYRPGQPITRGEVATLIARTLDIIEDSIKTQVFSDLNEKAFYYEAVQLLTGTGAIEGYPDNTFRPTNSATRAEVAVILYRLYAK
jgi:hypothetical protein